MKMFQKIFLGVLVMVLPFSACANSQNTGSTPRYARAQIPTPVLNTPDFRSAFGGADRNTLALDDQGLIRAVEFIALPGTVFRIEKVLPINGVVIYQVSTDEYPPQKTGLYIDSRFVLVSASAIPARAKQLPSKDQILDKMFSNRGLPYVWGGNISEGIAEMVQFYPPAKRLSRIEEDRWILYGLDCSGLLYEATNGITPRNTSDLIHYGKSVMIEGLSPAEIAAKLRPLDLIVWKGHVIIVLDQNRTIESCLGCSPKGGVTIRDLKTVIREVMSARRPMNVYPLQTQGNEKHFVIRRWV